ncbi:MAG: DUF1631 family protein [Comamonas sp.]
MAVVATLHQRVWQKKLARQARLRFVGGLCTGLPEIVSRMKATLAKVLAKPGVDLGRLHVALSGALLDFEKNQQAWIDAATKLLRQSLLTPDALAEAASANMSFELVSDEAMEGKIVASRLSAQLLEAVGSSFDGVRRITQFLEGEELGVADVLRPEVWCLKLIEAWEQAEMDRSTLEVLRPELLDELIQLGAQAYSSAQQFYTEQNAASEEDLRANRIKRSEGEGGVGAQSLAGATTAHMVPGVSTGMAPAAALQQSTQHFGAIAMARQKASGVLAQLRGFLGSVVPSGGVAAGGGTPSVRMMSAGSGYAMSPALQQALVAQQTAIQSVWFNTVPAEYGGAVQLVAPVAMAARQQSSALKHVATSDEEKAIIEIIALMFQSILNEDRIPAGIRIWFARLQVPVLRVALAEPAFFNDTEHPARQLIDRMGGCVLGFEASALNGTALETEVKRVVQVIEQYPETGSRVFQLVLKEFQKFLEKNLTEQAPKAQELVSLAQQVEQKETLAIQYTIQLRDMLLDVPVDSDVRDFLFKQWPDVLAMSAIRFGAEHDNTKKFKKMALDLVWSASAKPSKEDRAKVIRQLPLLQTVLRQGLALANVVDERQDGLVKALMDIVASAFLAKTNEIPKERIDAMAERFAHLEDALDEVVTEEYPLSAESIELMLGIDTSAIHVIADNSVQVSAEVLEWAKNLAVGNWFMLDHNGSPMQVQYAWHSQHKQLQLFATPSGMYFLFQLRRLGNYLQSGLLAPRDAEGITARAARDALAKIEANPERLLQ